MTGSSLAQHSKRALRYCLAQRSKQKALTCPHASVSIAHRTASTLAQNSQQIFPSTSVYRITPKTQTQIVPHDVKAAAISKALYIDCLPPGVANQEVDKEFHQTFKKAVLETFFFTPVERHDRTLRNRQPCDLIVEGLFAELLKYFHAKVDRKKCNYMLDRDAYFQYPFLRTLPDEGLPAPFLVEGQLMYNILSDIPAAPLFSLEQCDQTRDLEITWPDIIKTTLDIEQAFHPENIIPGSSAASLPEFPYTRVILDSAPGAEWSDTTRARGIYFLFARLASEAIRDGYQPGDTLDTPRVGVFISSSAYSYHFVFYQLNTLDLISTDGIKNLAWGQTVENITTNLMPYKKVTPENLLGPAVLEEVCDLVKLTLLYDLPLRENVSVA
ncbi:hypothetical protein ACHWQZ_G002872 [Mnemiopsis leidyi]